MESRHLWLARLQMRRKLDRLSSGWFMPPRSTGLYWFAALLLVVGGVLAYVIFQDVANPHALANAMLVLAVTIAAAGVCIISATAHWWLKR